MSIFKVGPLDTEVLSLQTNPLVYFFSNSLGNVTGTINVYPRQSHVLKFISDITATTSSFFDETTQAIAYDKALKYAEDPNHINFEGAIQSYLTILNFKKFQVPETYKINVKRLIPEYSGSFSYVNYLKKIISGTLMPHYGAQYSNCNLSVTNYNSLCFISSSVTPSGAALMYPNKNSCYELPDEFTFNFYLNVRNKHADVRPGTILHLSGNYAISVVSGTLLDENGLAKSYGIQLQLSHSADFAPHLTSPGSYPNDLTFRFDNVLSPNSWHNVLIRWGTNLKNSGTGSILIDDVVKGEFVIPSASIRNPNSNAQCLVVGNFDANSNVFTTTRDTYFSSYRASAYGYQSSSIGVPSTVDDDLGSRNNVGYFELHDLSISGGYGESTTTTPTNVSDYKFYLPPYFMTSSSIKLPQAIGDLSYGGLIVSPRIVASGSTSTPHNLSLAMSCGAHLMNIENYLTDFATMQTPLTLHLTSSVTSKPITTSQNINDYFYATGSNAARNLLILPCDDGNFTFKPSNIDEFVEDSISLTSFISSSFNIQNLNITTADPYGDIIDPNNLDSEIKYIADNLGISPLKPFVSYNDTAFLFQNWYSQNKQSVINNTFLPKDDRLQPTAFFWKHLNDTDTTQVVIFDVSNLYYGDGIEPGSFVLSDTSITGSGGQVSITIKDNGMGGLYRADANTTHAIANNIGNIFYNEGLIIIKNPSLYFFGKDEFEMSMRGNRNVHVMKIETLAPRNTANSSSNPSYIQGLRPSADQIDEDDNFVYITGINFHDDNLNVVARTKLAQPIIKRDRTKLMFRTKIDF